MTKELLGENSTDAPSQQCQSKKRIFPYTLPAHTCKKFIDTEDTKGDEIKQDKYNDKNFHLFLISPLSDGCSRLAVYDPRWLAALSLQDVFYSGYGPHWPKRLLWVHLQARHHPLPTSQRFLAKDRFVLR